MLSARCSSPMFMGKREPWKVVVSTITLVAFLFSTIYADVCWAAQPYGESAGAGFSEERRPVVPAKEVNPATFNLPEYLGSVKDAWKGDSGKVVIHIQDAHCNYAAEKKISEIINYLNREYGIDTINLEGGAEGYELSIFTGVKDTITRERVSDHFVKKGLVSGAEYYAINNPEKVKLWGVEDVNAYSDNLKVYRESLKHKDEVDRYLKSISYILSSLKLKIYPKELLELDSKYAQYKAGNIDFKEYLAFLVHLAGARAVDIKKFANIYLLNQVLGEEEKIDFKKADGQREALMDKLRERLSMSALKELVGKSVEFRSGLIQPKDFYSYLMGKARIANIELNNFPELQKYITYVSVYGAVDKSTIMKEMDGLEAEIKETLFQNDAQRSLDKLSRNLALLKNIFNTSISSEDYAYYKNNEDSFDAVNYESFINKYRSPYNITAKLDDDIANMDRYRKEISKFYEYSFKRDEAFIKNIKFKTAPPNTILITGGFHTENLAELFRKRGISYVSIMPNFNNRAGYESPYFKLLEGKVDGDWLKVRSILSSMGAAIAVASILNKLGEVGFDERSLAEARLMIRMEIARSSGKGLKLLDGDRARYFNAEWDELSPSLAAEQTAGGAGFETITVAELIGSMPTAPVIVAPVSVPTASISGGQYAPRQYRTVYALLRRVVNAVTYILDELLAKASTSAWLKSVRDLVSRVSRQKQIDSERRRLSELDIDSIIRLYEWQSESELFKDTLTRAGLDPQEIKNTFREIIVKAVKDQIAGRALVFEGEGSRETAYSRDDLDFIIKFMTWSGEMGPSGPDEFGAIREKISMLDGVFVPTLFMDDFMFEVINDSGNTAVKHPRTAIIQKKVVPLDRFLVDMSDKIKEAPPEEKTLYLEKAEKVLGNFRACIVDMWSVRAIDWDPQPKNYGSDKDGKVTAFDVDGINDDLEFDSRYGNDRIGEASRLIGHYNKYILENLNAFNPEFVKLFKPFTEEEFISVYGSLPEMRHEYGHVVTDLARQRVKAYLVGVLKGAGEAFQAPLPSGFLPQIFTQARIDSLRSKGWTDRQISALGGLENIFFSGVVVSGLAYLSGLLFDINPTIGLVASSVISVGLFTGFHWKTMARLIDGKLILAPPAVKDRVVIFALGSALSLVYLVPQFLIPSSWLAVTVALPLTIVSHGVYNTLIAPGLRSTLGLVSSDQMWEVEPQRGETPASITSGAQNYGDIVKLFNDARFSNVVRVEKSGFESTKTDIYLGYDALGKVVALMKFYKNRNLEKMKPLLDYEIMMSDLMDTLIPGRVPELLYNNLKDKNAINYYLIMEYVPGAPMDKLGQDFVKMPVRKKLDIMMQVAEIMKEINKMKIVYSDLKPANLILDENGKVYLIDFNSVTYQGERLRGYSPLFNFYSMPSELERRYPSTTLDIHTYGATFLYMILGEKTYNAYWNEYKRAKDDESRNVVFNNIRTALAGTGIPEAATAMILKCIRYNWLQEAYSGYTDFDEILTALEGAMLSVRGPNGKLAELFEKGGQGGIERIEKLEHVSEAADIYRGYGVDGNVKALMKLYKKPRSYRRAVANEASVGRKIHEMLPENSPEIFYDNSQDPNAENYYILMENISGKPFDQLDFGSMPVGRKLDIMVQTAEIMKEVNGAGKIYMDLKPSNLILGKDGRVYLIDFNLVGNDRERTTLRFTTRFNFHAAQLSQGELSPAFDIHAYGATFLYMSLGKDDYLNKWDKYWGAIFKKDKAIALGEIRSALDKTGLPNEVAELIYNCIQYNYIEHSRASDARQYSGYNNFNEILTVLEGAVLSASATDRMASAPGPNVTAPAMNALPSPVSGGVRSPVFPSDIVHMESMPLVNSGQMKWRNIVVTDGSLGEVRSKIKGSMPGDIRIMLESGIEKEIWVDNDLKARFGEFGFKYKLDFINAISEFLQEQFKTSPPISDDIVIVLLGQSTHLFEDHKQNGFIGINKQLFNRAISETLRYKLLKVGLGHEIKHEAGVDKTEDELLADDLAYAINLEFKLADVSVIASITGKNAGFVSALRSSLEERVPASSSLSVRPPKPQVQDQLQPYMPMPAQLSLGELQNFMQRGTIPMIKLLMMYVMYELANDEKFKDEWNKREGAGFFEDTGDLKELLKKAIDRVYNREIVPGVEAYTGIETSRRFGSGYIVKDPYIEEMAVVRDVPKTVLENIFENPDWFYNAEAINKFSRILDLLRRAGFNNELAGEMARRVELFKPSTGRGKKADRKKLVDALSADTASTARPVDMKATLTALVVFLESVEIPVHRLALEAPPQALPAPQVSALQAVQGVPEPDAPAERNVYTAEALEREYNPTSRDPVTVIGLPQWVHEKLKKDNIDTETYLSSLKRDAGRWLGSKGRGDRQNLHKIEFFFIGANSIETDENINRALEKIKTDQAIVVFAPQGAKIESADQVMVVPDAYTDTDMKNETYPDILTRVTITRLLAWCKEMSGLKNGDGAGEALKVLTDYLGNVTGQTITASDLNALLTFLLANQLRIRPVRFKDITDWNESYKAIEVAA